MKLTGQRIVSDIITLIRETPLASAVSGSIYRERTRPRSSNKEDILVIYTEADAEQFQTGVVTLNVYVPDIRSRIDGVSVPDSARLEELERLCQESVERVTEHRSNYLFSLREAVHSNHDDEIGQSFVVARLSFKHYE